VHRASVRLRTTAIDAGRVHKPGDNWLDACRRDCSGQLAQGQEQDHGNAIYTLAGSRSRSGDDLLCCRDVRERAGGWHARRGACPGRAGAVAFGVYGYQRLRCHTGVEEHSEHH